MNRHANGFQEYPDPEKHKSDYWNDFYTSVKSHKMIRKMQCAVRGLTPFDYIRIGDAELELMRFHPGGNRFKECVDSNFYEKHLGINPLKMPYGKFKEIRDEFTAHCLDADILATHRHSPNINASMRANSVLKALVPGKPYLESEVDVVFNSEIFDQGFVLPLLAGKRILLIGNSAPELMEKMQDVNFLKEYAKIGMPQTPIDVAGAVFVPHHGDESIKQLESIWESVKGHDFDLALISASFTGKIIAGRIKKQLGKIALDIGWNMQFMTAKSSPVAPAGDWDYMSGRRGYTHLFPGRKPDYIQERNRIMLKKALYTPKEYGMPFRLDIPLSFYMDPLKYCELNNTSLQDELAAREGEKANLYLLGMLHRTFNGLTDVFIGSIDRGLDGYEIPPEGMFPLARMPVIQTRELLSSLKIPFTEELCALKRLLEDIKPDCKYLTVRKMAEIISSFYRFLAVAADSEIKRLNYPSECTLMSPANIWDKDEYIRRNPNAGAVAALFESGIEKLKKYYKRFYLFCSYGTGDYVPGGSDVDIYGILNDGVIYSPEMLVELRNEHQSLYELFFAAAPLQHHGILSLSEADLDFYHEAICPRDVIEMGLCADLMPAAPVKCRKISLPSVHKSFFCQFVKSTMALSGCQTHKLSLMELQWHMGLLSMGLTVLNQLSGGSNYKRDALNEAARHLEKYDSDLLQRATRFREKLGNSEGVAYLKRNILNRNHEFKLDEYLKTAHAVRPDIELIKIVGDDYFIEMAELAAALYMDTYSDSDSGLLPCCGNFPVRKEVPLYEDIKKKITEAASFDNASVYFFGAVTAPGISDIDFIYVPPASSGNSDRSSSAYDRLSRELSKEPYFNVHPPFIVPENMLDDVKYMYPVDSMVKPCGEEIFHYKPGDRELDDQRLLALTEICVSYFLQDTLLPLLKKSIDVRFSLLRLNGLRHAMRIAGHCMERTPEYWVAFEKEVAKLRADWFSLKKTEQSGRLLKLLTDALYIQLDIIGLCSAETHKRFELHCNIDTDGIRPLAKLSNICFVLNWNRENALDMMLDSWVHGEEQLFLPFEFYGLYYCYGQYSPELKRKLKHNVLLGEKYIASADIFDNCIPGRAGLIEKYLRYAKECKNMDVVLSQMAVLSSETDMWDRETSNIYDLCWTDFYEHIPVHCWSNPYRAISEEGLDKADRNLILDAILERVPENSRFNWLKTRELFSGKVSFERIRDYFNYIRDEADLYEAMFYFYGEGEIAQVEELIGRIKQLPAVNPSVDDFIKRFEREPVLFGKAVQKLMKAGAQCPVIYGAGKHTARLLKRSGILNAFRKVYIADDGRKGLICGIQIMPLPEACRQGADAVLISSDAFEEQMFRKVSGIIRKPESVVTIYNDYKI